MTTIEVTCCNDGCNNRFRVPEYARSNSTIKNNPDKQECRICKNKKLLRQSTFFERDHKSKANTNKYVTRTKSGKKRLKSPRERFYSSTAWKWFSRYILLYYSIDGTVVQCSTCDTFKSVNDRECHTGHWIKVFDGNSSNYATAFEFTNLGPQCSKCNNYMGGRERLMANWLKEQHGQEELDRLQMLSKHPFKLDDFTLQQIADEYRTKVNQLLEERGWKNPWKK